jgi:LPXTG-motif cell wall-anchored protein
VTTDDDGFYFFDNLLPGVYQIRFTPPAGYVPTTSFSGDDEALDSNADNLGWSDQFTLGPSNPNVEPDVDNGTDADFVDPTIDAGFVTPTVGVGNYTWIDADKDGVQDVNEPPLEGVKVELLDANGDPVTDAFGLPVGEVFTDENGFYFFDNLLPGTYTVRFTLPEGYKFTTTSSAGSTSANDSNPIPTAGDPRVGVTPAFTLTANTAGDMEEDTADDYGATFINPTIDAGVTRSPLILNIDPRWFQRILPKTGIEGGLKVLLGVYAILLGVTLVVLARRRQAVLGRMPQRKR